MLDVGVHRSGGLSVRSPGCYSKSLSWGLWNSMAGFMGMSMQIPISLDFALSLNRGPGAAAARSLPRLVGRTVQLCRIWRRWLAERGCELFSASQFGWSMFIIDISSFQNMLFGFSLVLMKCSKFQEAFPVWALHGLADLAARSNWVGALP